MSRLLAEMTWTGVSEAVSAGIATVILPLGATEQHGPHLPLGTDTFRAAALAERLAAQLPGSLVAPVLPVGCSDEHRRFSGLLSLDCETLATVIVNCAQRMADWGVRQLVLLSAHGGNDQALALAAERINQQLPRLHLWVLPAELTMMSKALLAVAEKDNIAPETVGIHAGESETSEMLHLRPDLVRMRLAAPGYTGDMVQILQQLREAGLRSITPNGVLGDPTCADGARGERYLEEQATDYREQIMASHDAEHSASSTRQS